MADASPKGKSAGASRKQERVCLSVPHTTCSEGDLGIVQGRPMEPHPMTSHNVSAGSWQPLASNLQVEVVYTKLATETLPTLFMVLLTSGRPSYFRLQVADDFAPVAEGFGAPCPALFEPQLVSPKRYQSLDGVGIGRIIMLRLVLVLSLGIMILTMGLGLLRLLMLIRMRRWWLMMLSIMTGITLGLRRLACRNDVGGPGLILPLHEVLDDLWHLAIFSALGDLRRLKSMLASTSRDQCQHAQG